MALMLNPAAPVAAAGKPGLATRAPRVFGATTSIKSRRMRVVAQADMLGDFGARDPFPEELASNWGENTLGNVDTLHRILIPSVSVLSLSRVPLDPAPTAPLSEEDARKLLHKIVGWRLLFPNTHDNDEALLKLECVWKVKDQACGEELSSSWHPAGEGNRPRRHLHHHACLRSDA